jgi:predicted nucleic acid-binding protein
MRAVFADASYWIALLNPKDDLHEKAQALSSSLKHIRFITSEMVLTEVLNDFSGRGEAFRLAACSLVEDLYRDPNVSVIAQSSRQFQDAFLLYSERRDKTWGLTDCASFRIMPRGRLVRALTHDHDFVQAGFQALLRA